MMQIVLDGKLDFSRAPWYRGPERPHNMSRLWAHYCGWLGIRRGFTCPKCGKPYPDTSWIESFIPLEEEN